MVSVGADGGPDEVLLLAFAPAAAPPADVAPVVERVWAWVGRVGGGLLVEGALAEVGCGSGRDWWAGVAGTLRLLVHV